MPPHTLQPSLFFSSPFAPLVPRTSAPAFSTTSSQPRIAIPLVNTLYALAPRLLTFASTLHPQQPLYSELYPFVSPLLWSSSSDYNTTPPHPTIVPYNTTTNHSHVAVLQLRCPAAPPPTSQRSLAQPSRRPIAEGAPDLGSAAQQAVPPSPHSQGIQRRAPYPHRIQARLRGRQVI